MLMPLDLQSVAHLADAAIHHVRRSNDIGTSLCLRKGHFNQRLDRAIINDDAIFNKTVMAIDVIWIERDIGHHRNIRGGVLDGAGRLIAEVVRVPRLCTVFGL